MQTYALPHGGGLLLVIDADTFTTTTLAHANVMCRDMGLPGEFELSTNPAYFEYFNPGKDFGLVIDLDTVDPECREPNIWLMDRIATIAHYLGRSADGSALTHHVNADNNGDEWRYTVSGHSGRVGWWLYFDAETGIQYDSPLNPIGRQRTSH